MTATTPSEEVLETLADAEGVEPADLSPPLYTAIDPDALNSLFHGDSADLGTTEGRTTFRYQEYLVTVTAAGDVSVAQAEGRPAGQVASEPVGAAD